MREIGWQKSWPKLPKKSKTSVRFYLMFLVVEILPGYYDFPVIQRITHKRYFDKFANFFFISQISFL